MGLNMKVTKKDNIYKVIGTIRMELTNVHTGKKRIYSYHNMFLTFGKNAIAQRFAGQVAGEITYCALGTGTNAPALSDTKLQTEIARKLISVRNTSGNVFTANTFFTTAEANGTLREAGLFGNAVGRTASGTADSGQIYCRSAINRVKTPNDTLSLTWTVQVG